jgi:Nucleotide modification associated domain 5
MSRLTKDIREQMARKLVAHRYTDEAKELVRLNKVLGDRAYKHCYTKKTLDAMGVISKEFPKVFKLATYMRVNACGLTVGLGGSFNTRWVSVPQATAHEAKYLIATGDYYVHDISDDTKLSEEIRDFATRCRGFDEVCMTAFNEALSVLNTMSTDKKLAEAWPEAMPVIGDLIPESQRTLPVVQVSAINAKFKLPPKTGKEE